MSAGTLEHEPGAPPNPKQKEVLAGLSAAEQLYRAIEADEDPGSSIADLLRDSSAHGEVGDRIIADEVGGLAIAEHTTTTDEVPLLLGKQPTEELGEALQEIAETPRYGEDALETIIAEIERVEQEFRDRPDHQNLAAQHPEAPAKESSKSPEIQKNDEKLNTYLKGFSPPHEIAQYIEDLPPVSEEVAVKILDKFTSSYDTEGITKVLGRFPSIATEERLAGVFSHPAEVARLVTEKPAVLQQMSEYRTRRGSEFLNLVQLYDGEADESRRGRIVRNVETLLNPDATDLSKNMAHSLLKLSTLKDIGEIPYGEVAFSAVESYRPEQNLIGELPIPLASRLPEHTRTVADIPEKPLKEMSDDEKRLCLKEEFANAHLTPEGAIDTSAASIADLRGEFQELFLAERVEASVEKSNDSVLKEAATQRNMEIARSGDKFIKAGDLIHTTHAPHSEVILRNGLVCGELVGEGAEADAFPFNVDFYRVDVAAAEQADPVRAVSSRIKENSVTFVLDRGDNSKKQYPDRTASHNNHRLILGAVPSTEIKAAVLHSAEGPQNDINFRNLTDQIVDHGVYMPVIDDEGRLLFTPEDFMARTPSSKSSRQSMPDGAMNSESVYKNPTPPWERVRTERPISI